MTALDKKDPSESLNGADKSPNIATNTSVVNKPLTEMTASSQKNLSYIFKLDVTEKKLENISKKIEKLTDKLAELVYMINEKRRVYFILEKQYYDASKEEKELANSFSQNLVIYGLKDVQPLINPQAQENFLQNYKTPEDKASMKNILDSLYLHYSNTLVKQNVILDIQDDMVLIQKEITGYQTKYADTQDKIIEMNKKYKEVDAQWLLKLHESSDAKVFLPDFIAPPKTEEQLKKIILTYNNAIDAKRFWVSLPKGILFVGEPGTGKSFAAKVLASEIGRKMYHIKAHDLFSENIIDPNEMLYAIFNTIIKSTQDTQKPCIVFLDEIEKIISSMWEYNSAAEKIISNTIIKSITNIQKSGLDIIIVGAIGKKNKIDEIFLKYNLFDNQVFLELPTADERKRLFEYAIQKAEKRAKLKLFDPGFLDELVQKTDGFSAEYIKQLITVCVREYFCMYLDSKPSFVIGYDDLWTIIEKISETKKTAPVQDALSLNERKKAINKSLIQNGFKDPIFGELEGQKKINLLQYMLEATEWYAESDIKQIFPLALEKYQKRKTSYHKQALIQNDFILEKIGELRDEDKMKGKPLYLHQK